MSGPRVARAEATTPEADADHLVANPDLHSASAAYASRFKGPAGSYLLSVQTRALMDLLAPWPGASVLDVGGGHGQAAAPLIEAGYSVTVLASSEAAFGEARVRAPRASFVTGDLADPPFPDGSIDVAIALRMISHVADWRALVAGLCRVARQAVIVDFALPYGSNALTPVMFGMKRRFEGNTRTFTMVGKREVGKVIAAHGFRTDAMIGQFVLPMAIHRALGRPGLSRGLEGALGGVGLARLVGTPVVLRAVRCSDGVAGQHRS